MADIATAIATWGLLLIGAWVAWHQIALMRDTMVETRNAAQAASDSNTKLERPWVRVYVSDSNVMEMFRQLRPDPLVGDPEFPDFPDLKFPFGCRLQFTVVNDGRSPAFLVGGSLNFRMITEAQEDGPPPYDWDWWESFPTRPLPPEGADPPHSGVIPYSFKDTDYAALCAGTASLMFFGVVLYFDVHDKLHSSRFCLGWTTRWPRKWGSGDIVRFGPIGPDHWTGYE